MWINLPPHVGDGIARVHGLDKVQAGDVLVTDMTDPNWEPVMKRAAAIVTNRGGRTCHAAIIARELGIQPCYQNHSGAKYVGAGVWDMAMLMRDHPPADLAWAFDILHATVEGSTSWPT